MINMTKHEKTERIKALRFNNADDEKRTWTNNERFILKTRFNNGIGITDIALELNRTENAVMQQILASGLYQNRKRRNHNKKVICEQGCLCPKCDHFEQCSIKDSVYRFKIEEGEENNETGNRENL